MAESRASVQKALILGLTPSIRARTASITSEGLIFFDAIIRANCWPDIFHSSGILTPLLLFAILQHDDPTIHCRQVKIPIGCLANAGRFVRCFFDSRITVLLQHPIMMNS
jgi:hypothetical protein